ncbi:protease [Lithospermum erythrorhizon]|uniref:Protease n=1 Tax=Lithospermum erythrorhizon TaxID=34254 RepID=A0AAV3NY00_LITER
MAQESLIGAATEFALYPGSHSDASAQDFLGKYPLPDIINALQKNGDYPVLLDCLDRIFRTKYGASLIPHYMPFVEAGLLAHTHELRCLACKAVSRLLDESTAIHLILHHSVYQHLLLCLINGDELVASAATEAITHLARFPKTTDIIFPHASEEATHLGVLASKSSSLARVRILALIVKLFSISRSLASVICNSNLLQLLEAEVKSTNDTLVMLSVLELLYELSEVQHSTEFLSRTTILHLLSSIISDAASDSILRARSMMITGRLLSKENAFEYINQSSFETVVSAIDRRFDFLESQDADECECALEALGEIGLCKSPLVLFLFVPR